MQNIGRYLKYYTCVSYGLSCLFVHGHGFIAGTPINTSNGLIPIEQLKPNDLVVSRDKKDGSFVFKTIKSCKKKTTKEIIELSVESNNLPIDISADPHQRFYVLNASKWRIAKDLKPGDILSKYGDGFAIVKAVKKIRKRSDVYRLAVNGCHNFCISEQSIIAHNILPFIPAVTACAVSATSYVASAAVSAASYLGLVTPLSGGAMGIVASFTPAQVFGVGILGTLGAGIGREAYKFFGSFFSDRKKAIISIPTPKRNMSSCSSLSIRERFEQTNHVGIQPPDLNALVPSDQNKLSEVITCWIPGYNLLSYTGKNNVLGKTEWLEKIAGGGKFSDVNSKKTILPTASINNPLLKKDVNSKNLVPPIDKGFTSTIPTQPLQLSLSSSQTFFGDTKSCCSNNLPTKNEKFKRARTKSNVYRFAGNKSISFSKKRCHRQSKKNEKKNLCSNLTNISPRRSTANFVMGVTDDLVVAQPIDISLTNQSDNIKISPTCSNDSREAVGFAVSAGVPSGKKDSYGQESKKFEVKVKSSISAAGGAPIDPDDWRRGDNGKLWNPLNIKPKTEPIREKIYIPKASSPVEIQNEVVAKFLSDVDKTTQEPFVCTHDPKDKNNVCFGKVVGMQWHGGKVVLRADFDPEKGAHFNLKDCRAGKGDLSVSLSIPLQGDAAIIEAFLMPLNTVEEIMAALALYQKKITDKEFENKCPGKVREYEKWIEILKNRLNSMT